jgi:heme exporter protein A
MLQASEISCVRGNRELFDRLSFSLSGGTALRVQGENGAGKTSLLRILAGLSPASAGTVKWDDALIAKSSESFRRDLLFLGHTNALKEDLTPVENLQHALAVAGICPDLYEMRAALEQDGLGAVAQYPVQWLSQGQKRRVAMARLAFGADRRLWILDEPFSALDAVAVRRLVARLCHHVTTGGLLVFTTHQEVVLDVPMEDLVLQ